MARLKEFNEERLSDLIKNLFVDVDSIPSVEAAANMLAKGMHETFMTDERSELALSRIFHLFEYGALPPDIQRAVKGPGENRPDDKSLYLTLLGTYGDEPAWRDRTLSKGHKVIQLNPEAMEKIPMVARMFQQMGFGLDAPFNENFPGISFSVIGRSYGMFYVAEAENSPYIPAQDFVSKYGIKTVFGSGVKLPNNDVSVYIGFTRANLDEAQAICFSPLMSLFWQRVHRLIEKGYFV